jgi:two-component system, OmpR family, sensor kinase
MTVRRTKLLLIQDNAEDTSLLRAALSDVPSANFDANLLHVTSVTEAVAQLAQGGFDLILFDLAVPDARGLETVAAIDRAAPGIPIVALSGLDDEQLAVRAMHHGAEDYLVKSQLDSEVLARSIRYAINRQRIKKQIREHQSRQAALHQIHLAVTSTLDLRTRLDRLLERIADYYPHYVAAVRLRNEETGNFETLACRNLDQSEWSHTFPESDSGKGLIAVVAKARAPVVIPDMQNDPRVRRPEFARRNGLVSYLGVPLLVRNELIGVINFYTREKHEFSGEEIEFLDTLAGQTAVAIANSRLFEELKTAKAALEKSLEIKSVLVGVMAHELKTPIQVIMGNASLLREGFFGALTHEQQQRMRAIESGAEEVLQLIESTLDMIRLERGKMPLAVAEISVPTLLAEIQSEFRDSFQKTGVNFSVSQPPADVVLKSDRIKLKEILRNLLDNAQKFTPMGKVALCCRSNDRGQVEFIVRDTGIGIEKELLPKIFEPFYQVDASARPRSAGLGLNIVKKLVAAISGNVEVASEVGKGTTFRVTLPKEIAAHGPT